MSGKTWPVQSKPIREEPAVLFLHRRLLLDLAPRADFEPAAHPAERLAGCEDLGLRAANRAFARLFQAIRRDRLLSLFQDLGRDHRFGFWLRFTSHIPQSAFTMTESVRT